MRDFDQWLATFRDSIADYTYYIDFAKVRRHVEDQAEQLQTLGSLVGAPDIESAFVALVRSNPAVLQCISLC